MNLSPAAVELMRELWEKIHATASPLPLGNGVVAVDEEGRPVCEELRALGLLTESASRLWCLTPVGFRECEKRFVL
jgi:hypothetical protein